MKKRQVAAIAMMSISCFMIGMSQTAVAESDIANGKVKYEQYCQVCHGAKGHGDGPAGSTMQYKPKNIANEINELFSSNKSVVSDVLEGKVKKGMPAWSGILTESDVADIIEYIKSIQ